MKSVLIYTAIALLFAIAIFALFPFGAHIDGDTGYYFSMAVQISENGIFGLREIRAPMGYPLLLNVAKYLFIGDFLQGALFINVICFSLVFILLAKMVTETGKEHLPLLERIYSVILLFVILLMQYFNSRILFSAWPETPFITFTVAGLYFIGQLRKNESYTNFSTVCALTFFVAAWYCKYVGVVGVVVFFLFSGLLTLQDKRSIWTAMVKSGALLVVLSVLVIPAAVRNYLKTGNVLGSMANPNQSQYIFMKFEILDNYSNRVFEFFNNIFAHLVSSFYLVKYPDLVVGIFAVLLGFTIFWIFRANFRSDKDAIGLIQRLFFIRHIEWYIWGTAYICAMMIRLLSHNFTTQAMSRYASLLIPIVSLIIIDFIGTLKPAGRRIVFPILITIFTVLYIISINSNLPDYSQVPKRIYINNFHNLRGYPQFKQMQEMLYKIESVYFLPRRNNWPIADKFYALFPCKEFYVSRKWSHGGYNEKIYPIPKFNAPYAVISDYEADEVLRFITGKGEIIEGNTVLGFSIFLVKPYNTFLRRSIHSTEDRSSYLGHGFISHGCR
jgi:hypothetical protein